MTLEAVSVFGIVLPVQGLLAIAGAVLGQSVFVRMLRKTTSLSAATAELLGIAGLLGAVLGGHLFAVLQQAEWSWVDLEKVLTLQASLGALGAGALTISLVARWWRLSPYALWDAGAWAWIAGWPFVRLGCALVHDHLGPASNAPLAVAFERGGRYDLGVLEWLGSLVLLAGIVLWWNRRRPLGEMAAVTGLGWVAMRLPLEWLRLAGPAASDSRAAVFNFVGLLVIAGAALVLLRVSASRSHRQSRHS